jgi:hypothetical protein
MLPVRINQEEWDGEVVWYEEWTGVYRVWVRKPEVQRPLEDLCVYMRIILKLILQKSVVKAWIG